jgi:hypothetical protein
MLAQPIIEAEKKWAQLVVTNAKSILIRNKKVASGRLINSVRYTINSQGKIKFLYDKDGKWVTSGRKRNSRFPPPAAISKWIKQKGLKGRDPKTGRFIKDKTLTYLISRGIAKKGIKPLPFMKMAIDKTIKQLPKILKPVVAKSAKAQVLKNIGLIKP